MLTMAQRSGVTSHPIFENHFFESRRAWRYVTRNTTQATTSPGTRGTLPYGRASARA